jgi:hypothetical protein
MYDCVVSFGDSWPAGVELLPHEKTYGELIAEYFDAEFVNCAVPASSIEALVWQLQKFLDRPKSYQNILALFFLTDYSRTIKFDRLGKPVDVFKDRFHEHYIKYIYNDSLGVFKANMCLHTLQHMCLAANIDDRYVMGWTKFPLRLHGINKEKILAQGTVSCLNMFKVYDNDPTDDANFIYYDYNHYIRPNQCHPNQLGHQTIADQLVTWITQ